VVIVPKFEYAGEFNGGLASVAVGYTKIYSPHRGVSVISLKIVGKHGYVDKTGRFVPKMIWRLS
jgi:hypothetical protein